MATGLFNIGDFLVLDIDIISDQGVSQEIVSGGLVTASGYPWKRLTRTPENRDLEDPGTINQRRRLLQTSYQSKSHLESLLIFEVLCLSLMLLIVYPRIC